jgi:hypothetical protein
MALRARATDACRHRPPTLLPPLLRHGGTQGRVLRRARALRTVRQRRVALLLLLGSRGGHKIRLG